MRRGLTPALVSLTVCLAAAPWLAGCLGTGAAGRAVTTRAPGVETIPLAVAVHPLLSTVPTASGHRAAGPLQPTRQDGAVLLQPPARTELLVTGSSQMLTELLEAELSYAGLRIKALPVQVSEGPPGSPAGFGIGLDLLDQLRQRYGLQAVVVGNVHFARDPAAPGEDRVAAAFLRVVDTGSLDVLAHVALQRGRGLALEDAAAALAAELAHLAAAQPAAADGGADPTPAGQPEATEASGPF